MTILKSLILLTGFLSAFAGYAGANFDKSDCHPFPAPMQGGYCVDRPSPVKNPDIVYYLHGRGLNEHTWAERFYYTAQIRKEWQRRKMEPPTVVSFSFGETWLLASKNSSPVSGLFDYVTGQLIPEIEASLGGLHGRRLILGESMGGLNSLQLSLRTLLFRKAAILCAPIASVTPFSTAQEIQSYVQSTAVWQISQGRGEDVLKNVQDLMELGRAFFPSEEEWMTADPLTLARRSSGRVAPEFYMAAGLHDRFALYEGNEVFAKILATQGVTVDWRPQWGGHCAVDIPSLAEFLIR